MQEGMIGLKLPRCRLRASVISFSVMRTMNVSECNYQYVSNDFQELMPNVNLKAVFRWRITFRIPVS